MNVMEKNAFFSLQILFFCFCFLGLVHLCIFLKICVMLEFWLEFIILGGKDIICLCYVEVLNDIRCLKR